MMVPSRVLDCRHHSGLYRGRQENRMAVRTVLPELPGRAKKKPVSIPTGFSPVCGVEADQ